MSEAPTQQDWQRLDAMIDEVVRDLEAQRITSLEAQRITRAMHSPTFQSATQAAYSDGRSEERDRVLLLINDHLATLQPGSASAMAMEALRAAVVKP